MAKPSPAPRLGDELPSERLFRIADAAERLAVSQRTIWNWIRDGQLDVVRLGRSTRLRASDINRLAREGLPGQEPRLSSESKTDLQEAPRLEREAPEGKELL